MTTDCLPTGATLATPLTAPRATAPLSESPLALLVEEIGEVLRGAIVDPIAAALREPGHGLHGVDTRLLNDLGLDR